MFRSKKQPRNKHDIYISFHDENGQLVHEYIPADYSKFSTWIEQKYYDLRMYLGLPIYYWHIRHLMPPTSRKIADIGFMLHVYADHEGEPTDKYERRHFQHLLYSYKQELEYLLLPYVLEQKTKEPLMHEYYHAYIRRWIRPRDGRLKLAYHGLRGPEVNGMYKILYENATQDIAREKARARYRARQLKKNAHSEDD